MRVSYAWLKEYVDLDVTAAELASQLTLAGIAVDRVEDVGVTGVVVGEVLSVSAHPESDHLQVCLVRVAEGQAPVKLVTGAPNVRLGMKVAVALPGTELPGGLKIEAASFRGVLSAGMLCSAQELGIDPADLPGASPDGILELPPAAAIGTEAAVVLGEADQVLELDLTPNRADCMAMVNLAREAAAVTGGRLHLPEVAPEADTGKRAAEMVQVRIEAPDLCGRYVAKVIENVSIGPSPRWLCRRLRAAGIRPINNVVDITNFVMLEMGQPLHAFDYHTLEGRRIIVRRALPGESMVSLDEVTRQLDPEMLVIADAARPVAVAGVMGGLDTEITASTTTILLESAHFEGKCIRRTSRRLGLRSEASSRFEKGIDRHGSLAAANRAAALMAELAGGRVAAGEADVYVQPWTPPVIGLRAWRVNQILGTTLTQEQIAVILRRLRLEVRVLDDQRLEAVIPSYRADLTEEIDLIEEVARIHGYHQIPTTMPGGISGQTPRTAGQRMEERCREVLSDAGLHEVINYSFISPAAFDRLGLPPDHPWRDVVVVQNPLNEDQGVMRTTLLPGLLEVAARNTSRRVTDLGLFEVGRIFLPQREGAGVLPAEPLTAAGLVTGKVDRGWTERPVAMDFFYLKGVLEELLNRLGLADFRFAPAGDCAGLHPGRSAKVLAGEQVVGLIGELHPEVREHYHLSERVCVFQLDLEMMRPLTMGTTSYVPLPRFPATTRDMAVTVPQEVLACDIERAIAGCGEATLQRYRLFDVYQGVQVVTGKKSMAYTLVYQSTERTLTDEEVNAVHQRICGVLAEKFGAELR